MAGVEKNTCENAAKPSGHRNQGPETAVNASKEQGRFDTVALERQGSDLFVESLRLAVELWVARL